MSRRGRPGLGVEHVERVESSDETKQRLRAILQTLSGELSLAAAAQTLSMSEAHFCRLRDRALAGAAEALEPRPAGRPAAERDATDARVAELEAKVATMALELHVSHLREQLAVLMPHVVRTPGAEKKKHRRPR